MAISKATASSIAPAAKGDLVAGSATNDAAVLGVGANNTVLTADSAEATGLKWATPSSGGMTLLSTTTLSGSSTTISSINQTYKDLFVLISFAESSGATQTQFQPNSNNDSRWIGVDGNSTNTTFWTDSSYLNNNQQSANTQAHFGITISNYAQAVSGRATISGGGVYQSGGNTNACNFQGARTSTTAITSIKIATYSGTWSTGTVYIYGVN